jgi:hypothetical protein
VADQRAPRPTSTGIAKAKAMPARVGQREMVKRRTTPVARSARTMLYRRAVKSLQEVAV